jgi:phosphoesterase RecJ-like protein
MSNELFNLIENNKSIIILRHKTPDGDAIGSQMGLYFTLKHYYPDKEIYVTGDSPYFNIDGLEFSPLSEEIFSKSLTLILDTSQSHLTSDGTTESNELFRLSPNLVVIDHHKNDTNIDNLTLKIIENNYPANCLVITKLLLEQFSFIPKEAATYLFLGTISDTNRFMYCNSSNMSECLNLAGKLVDFGADITFVYDLLNNKSLDDKQKENKYRTFKLTKSNVAYRINSLESSLKNNMKPTEVSKKYINMMAGINEIQIWISFTETNEHTYLVEARSRGIVIVDILKSFGGGGHDFACGCLLSQKKDIISMLKALNRRQNEHQV